MRLTLAGPQFHPILPPRPKEPINPLPQPPRTSALPRPFHFLLFLAAGFWIVAARGLAERATQGLTVRFNLSTLSNLLQQLFFLFLLLIGFSVLRWISSRQPSARNSTPGNTTTQDLTRFNGIRATNALPARATTREEFLRGTALGWALVLAAVLPMMLLGSLHPEFNLNVGNLGYALLALLTIAVATLALEVAFRGFLFIQFIQATGPVFATLFLSLLYATLSAFRPDATALSILDTFLFAVLFCTAYLRTRALWIGWGIHFAWSAVAAIVFGLPIATDFGFNNLIFTSVTGPEWLTGGPYGPEASFVTAIVLIIGIFALHRLTRHYAWEYTYTPPVASGYPMDIAPPAAHTAMEDEAAAAPAPLVQILGATPTAASTNPVIDDHLNRNGH
jgi:membrane protease YdiL (CAAX protease family)